MRIILVSCTLLVVSWLISWKRPEKLWPSTKFVPGIVWIDTDWGIDRTDVTNFHWLEFMYWTKRVYGRNSKEYLAILPDTSLWLELDGRYHDFESDYLRSPKYRDFPVLGLTYEQMLGYCKWRSDRVFEYFLYKNDQLDWRITENPQDIISIDRFVRGELCEIRNPEGVKRLPQYTLPNKHEWTAAAQYNDLQIQKLSRKNKDRLNQASRSPFDFPFPANVDPTLKGNTSKLLLLLHCNVKKQLEEITWTTGDAWLQSHQLAPDETFKNYMDSTSLTVGFRCAFHWKVHDF
jgi:hypothetical protein